MYVKEKETLLNSILYDKLLFTFSKLNNILFPLQKGKKEKSDFIYTRINKKYK